MLSALLYRCVIFSHSSNILGHNNSRRIIICSVMLLLSSQQTAATSRYLIPDFCIRNIVARIKKDSNDDRKLINQTPLIFALATDGSLRTHADL